MAGNTKQREVMQWALPIYTLDKLDSLPTPTYLAISTASSTLYYNPGRNRLHEGPGNFVFQYTLEGRGLLSAGQTLYELPEGTGFLAEVSDPEICYYYSKTMRKKWQFMFLTFSDKSGATKALIREIGHVFDLARDSSIIKRLLGYNALKKQALEVSIGEGAMLVNSLLCALADTRRRPFQESRDMILIRQAHKLIEANLTHPYNASMLAEDLQVSQEHLSRIFSKHTSSTPYKLITKMKIQHACILLKQSSMSCKDVAVNLGYDPGSHFARLFKREIGMTPQLFRQNGSLPISV